ncbi:MAG TPA: hypothetical protein VIT65_27655 [Microlunatus sp.]
MLPLVASSLLLGCAPAEAGPARVAADDFQASVAARDWPSACELLSEDARTQLESTSARSCVQALPELELPRGTAADIQVWGHNATARVTGRALFLARFADGWRVVAAGCESRGDDRPYACSVRG